MSEQGYNGWQNYETWNVNLWISNDQGTYNRAHEMTRQAWDEAQEHPAYFTRSEQARITLADRIKEWVTDDLCALPTRLQASMVADLLGAALSEVDWFEIADNWLTDSEDIQGYEPHPPSARPGS